MKMTIVPFAEDNAVLERGKTSLPIDAPSHELTAKVVYAAERAGSKTAYVVVTRPADPDKGLTEHVVKFRPDGSSFEMVANGVVLPDFLRAGSEAREKAVNDPAAKAKVEEITRSLQPAPTLKTKTETPRGPRVIETIIQVLEQADAAGLTIVEVANKVDAITGRKTLATCRAQIGARIVKEKAVNLVTVSKGYYRIAK